MWLGSLYAAKIGNFVVMETKVQLLSTTESWNRLVVPLGGRNHLILSHKRLGYKNPKYMHYKLGEPCVTNCGSSAITSIRILVNKNWVSHYKLGQPLLINGTAIANYVMYQKLGQLLQIVAWHLFQNKILENAWLKINFIWSSE